VPLQCYSWQCHSNLYIFNNNNNNTIDPSRSLFLLYFFLVSPSSLSSTILQWWRCRHESSPRSCVSRKFHCFYPALFDARHTCLWLSTWLLSPAINDNAVSGNRSPSILVTCPNHVSCRFLIFWSWASDSNIFRTSFLFLLRITSVIS